MHTASSPAALLSLTAALAGAARRHAGTPQLPDALLTALLETLPAPDGAALVVRRGEQTTTLAKAGVNSGDPAAMPSLIRALPDNRPTVIPAGAEPDSGAIGIYPFSDSNEAATTALVIHVPDTVTLPDDLNDALQIAAHFIGAVLSQERDQSSIDISEITPEALLAAMTDVILVYDAAGRYISIAPTNPDRLYRPADDMPGKTVHQVLPPETADAFLGAIRQTLQTHTPQKIEYSLAIAGSTYWFEGTLTPLFADKVLCVTHDITAHKQIEEDLRQSRDKLAKQMAEREKAEAALAADHNLLRTLIDAVPDYIYAKDTKSRFILVNRQVLRSFNAETPEEVIGKTDFDFHPRELAEQYYADEQRIFQTGEALIGHEEPVITAAGEQIWVQSTKIPLRDDEGNIIGLVGLNRDVTRRKQVEAERERLLEAERRQRFLAETLAEISLVLTSQSELDAVLDQILKYARRLVPESEAVSIALLEGGDLQVMHWQVREGSPHEPLYTARRDSLDAMPLTAKAVRNRRPILVPDTRQEPRWRKMEQSEWIQSHIVAPIVLRGNVLGVLWLDGDRPHEFTEEDVRNLQPLINAAAIALDNARLLWEARQRAEREQRLNEIAAALQTRDDVTALLNTAVQSLGETLGARVGRVRLNVPDETAANTNGGQETTEQ